MDALQIRLTPEGHGWTQFELLAGAQHSSFLTSNLGPDPLAEMLRLALEALTVWQDEGPALAPHLSIELYGEPSALLIRLFPAAAAGARLVAYFCEDVDFVQPRSVEHRPDKTIVFEVEVGRVAFAHEVLRVASGTLAHFGFSGYDEDWGEYPTAALLRLSRTLLDRSATAGADLEADIDALLALCGQQPAS